MQAPKHGTVAAFEVVNEPNGQLWPQRGPSSDQSSWAGMFSVEGSKLVVQKAVAEMMTTLDAIADYHGQTMLCLAPSTSDADSALPRTTTNVGADVVLGEPRPVRRRAARRARPDRLPGRPAWAWSYHNYNDYELNQHARGMRLQEHLGKRWHGRRLNGVAELWCTEGGCRLTRVRQRFGANLNNEQVLNQQAEVIKEALHRHHWPRRRGCRRHDAHAVHGRRGPGIRRRSARPGLRLPAGARRVGGVRERGQQGENVPADAPPPV